MFDPKLKKIAQEIKAILEKNGVGGIVLIHSPDSLEYINKLDTPYSCISMHPNKELKVKTTGKGWSEAEKKKRIQDTLNMLQMISTAGASLLLPIIDLHDHIAANFDVDHGGINHSPDIENLN